MDLACNLKRLCFLALLTGLAGCDRDEIVGGGLRPREVVVVLNSIERSLTVFSPVPSGLDDVIGLGAAGSPVQGAVRDSIVVVPMGTFSAALVINLTNNRVRSIPLRGGSGATGVAFFDDSIVYVTNPNLNTVSRINVRTGIATQEVFTTVYPQAVVTVDDRVWVLTAELDINFQPTRAGRVTVIDDETRSATDTIELSGFNPAAGTMGPDGRVYIINSGTFGQADGSLSVVDPITLAEVEHHEGFGEFPGALAFGTDGDLYISSFSYGVAVWDPDTDAFVNSPDDPLDLEGLSSVSDVGFDDSGRFYAAVPGDCISPGEVIRVAADFSPSSRLVIPAGVCPIAVMFTEVVR